MANPYVYVILGIFLIALVGGGLFLLMALGVLPLSFLGAVQRLGGQLGGAVSNVVFTQPPGGVNSKGQLLFNGTPPGYGNPNEWVTVTILCGARRDKLLLPVPGRVPLAGAEQHL